MMRFVPFCSICMALVTFCHGWPLQHGPTSPPVPSQHRVIRSALELDIDPREAAAASAHVRRVKSEGSCRKPQPRIVKVADEYPNQPHKMYVPHCTILHRCSKDTGCCSSEAKVCVPKSQEEVKLFFQVQELLQDGSRRRLIEGLNFTNHTECMCEEINNFPR